MSDFAVEAYLQLEARLVAYLQSLQGGGGPLDDLPIYPGHGDANLDDVASYLWIMAERSDTQSLWHAGIELVDVKMLLATQADDTPLAIHNRRVTGLTTVFDQRKLNDYVIDGVVVPGFKTILNQQPGWGLSGWKAGNPPIEDGFDSVKRRRQCGLRYRAQCGVEL